MTTQIQVDVARINVELHLASSLTQIERHEPQSPTHFLDVDMITTSQTSRLMKEPYSKTDTHHLRDDLLEHQSIHSETLVKSVQQNLQSIPTDFTFVSIPSAISCTSSTAISQQLISICPSTDNLAISQPLTITMVPSMSILNPLIDVSSAQINLENIRISHLTEHTVSADEHAIVKTLL